MLAAVGAAVGLAYTARTYRLSRGRPTHRSLHQGRRTARLRQDRGAARRPPSTPLKFVIKLAGTRILEPGHAAGRRGDRGQCRWAGPVSTGAAADAGGAKFAPEWRYRAGEQGAESLRISGESVQITPTQPKEPTCASALHFSPRPLPPPCWLASPSRAA